jgi:hypothetical protein
MDEFNKTLRVALSISKRKMSEAINSRGYFVAKRAKENTPIGSREVIQSTTEKERPFVVTVTSQRHWFTN